MADSAAHWLNRSRAAQQSGDFDGMLENALAARQHHPDDAATGLRLAECYLFTGQVVEAIRVCERMEQSAGTDILVLQQIGERYTQCSQFRLANRCYRRAVELKPRDAAAIYNLAASCIALGELNEAERLLNEVIRLTPDDYDAWQNRSTLRKQTPESNHVKELESVLGRLAADDPHRIPVCYALAKELEDLGRFEDSFRHLQQGAVLRRRGMDYDVGTDIATMALISEVYSPERLRSEPASCESGRPVFVLGLPRSGTTLVDRIIGAHSQASSLGEINTLAFSLMRAVSESSTAPVTDRTDLIRRSATIDFWRLGDLYCDAIAQYGQDSARLIDKTPLNFLYLGLVHLTMPHARIIHLRRNPVDSCYAMYKTLFRMGYPFTYSLQDVGRYYIAYHRLMDHWRSALPGAFLDVDYESLVTNQEAESRRIVEWCGLEWEPACLEFHTSRDPAATASAAQVRQPVYTSSVNLWRNYERQLAPFVQKLREHGIDVD